MEQLPPNLVRALERRVTTSGAQPLVTWYQPATGARVEFSAITWANWVDKAVNLFGGLGADDAPVVGAPLLEDHPGHWMSWVWAQATWQVGGELWVGRRDQLAQVDVAVIGPADPFPVPGAETVACSLHPLGMGFSKPLPGITDGAELLSEPDLHFATPTPDDHVWLRIAGAEPGAKGAAFTGAELAAGAPSAQRVLVVGDCPTTVLEAWAAVLLGGGSLVLVDPTGAEPTAELLDPLVSSERVDRVWAS